MFIPRKGQMWGADECVVLFFRRYDAKNGQTSQNNAGNEGEIHFLILHLGLFIIYKTVFLWRKIQTAIVFQNNLQLAALLLLPPFQEDHARPINPK